MILKKVGYWRINKTQLIILVFNRMILTYGDRMLTGSVYIYDKNEFLLKKLDFDDYEKLSKNDFECLLVSLNAHKVVIGSISNHHQTHESMEVIWVKG